MIWWRVSWYGDVEDFKAGCKANDIECYRYKENRGIGLWFTI